MKLDLLQTETTPDSRLITNVCVVCVAVVVVVASLYVELLDTSAEQLPFLGLLTDDGSCSGRGVCASVCWLRTVA